MPPFPKMLVITFGKCPFDPFIQFLQFHRITDGSKMPRFIMHAVRRVSTRFQDGVQVIRRNLLSIIRTYTTPCLNGL